MHELCTGYHLVFRLVPAARGSHVALFFHTGANLIGQKRYIEYAIWLAW